MAPQFQLAVKKARPEWAARISSCLKKLGRFLGAVFVLSTFTFWVWAFSPWARSENPARLDDRSFTAWANERCSRAQAVINALPSPRKAQSPQQRAEHISRGSDELDNLLSALRFTASSLAAQTSGEGPPDADLAEKWLADWDIYISDRRAHEAKLRDATADTPDRDLWFLMSDAMPGGVYTERMDGFARLNNMDACQIPGDV